MLRLLDRVVGVAARAVDVRDRVAGGAGDAGLRRGIVVTSSNFGSSNAPLKNGTGSWQPAHQREALHASVALQRNLARLAHAGQVGRVVERAEMVGAVEPVLDNCPAWHFRQ